MIYCYFSCKKDEKLLAVSVAQLRAVEPQAVVYVANDKNDRAAVPTGCTEVLTSYSRCGSGNGLEAIEGELMTMQYILSRENGDFVTKIDSDVWTNCSDCIQPRAGEVEADFLGFESARMLMPGCGVYRLSKWAVKYALEETRRRWKWKEWNPDAIYSENFVIFKLICLCRTLHAELVPYTAGHLVGMHDDGYGNNERALGASFVHCGELLEDGSKAKREHVFMRMSLIQAEKQK